ncbi:MAG TPA: FecR domain-containing protein [Gemmatimonadaceae bacterium]|nr:FecR domain-containing protein [Gemmatimonadaceae bacterium]
MPDPSITPDDPRFLARALANELTEEEAAAFRRWLAEEPSRRWEFRQLERVWADAGRVRHPWDVEGALAAIKSRAADEVENPAPTRVRRPPVLPRFTAPVARRGRRVAWAAAAGLLAAAGIGTIARRAPRAAPPAASVAFREVRTDRGETARLRFPDGTELQLAPKSRLRYPANMLGPSRDLQLDGEAYVVAGKEGRAPLVIRTTLGTARDIGTRFVVSARPGAQLDVVVVEGLVVVRSGSPADSGARRPDSVLVRPGMLGRVTPDGRVRAPRSVRVDDYVAWLDGRLAFADAPLSEVLETVARWRPIEYRIDPRVAERHFTGAFDHRDRLGDIVDLIALTTNVRIDRRGDTLVVRDDPARSRPLPPHPTPSEDR